MWFILIYLTRNCTHLTNLKSLALNNPIVGFILTMILFSMSGIPPLGGFYVKFEIFLSVLNSSNYFLAYALFFLTVINFFYYLRIIKIVYFENSYTFYKIKNENHSVLRIIVIFAHLIILYAVLIQEPILYIIDNAVRAFL